MEVFVFLLVAFPIGLCMGHKSQDDAFDRLTKNNVLQGRADVVFLLDRSGSVGHTNFEILKGFVESLLMHVVVDANATRVAVISYSATAKLHINFLSDPKSKCVLSQHLQDVVYEDSGATDIAAALEEALMVLSDARPDVNKVVILISDGMDTHGADPVPVAHRLKTEIGVELFTIGIGRFLMTQLKSLASSPNHFYTSSGFKDFKSLARKIRGDPHERQWSIETPGARSCHDLCVSPYLGKPNDPGCCDHHAKCSCALLSGTHACVCQPGYFGLSGTWGECRACPRGTYKSKLEPSSSCTACPRHSTTAERASTSLKDCYCEEGYIGNPSEGIECVAVKCPPLQNPTNGFLLGKCDNVFSSTCHFMCEEGYDFVDPNSDILTCQSDGRWSENSPVCQRILCRKPVRPIYGKVECPGNEMTIGTRCSFSCPAGFVLQGSQVRECLPSKNWSGDETKCIVVQCPIPKPLLHGKIVNCGSTKKPTFMDTCIFICNGGYKLIGPEAVTCNEQGHLVDAFTQKQYSSNPPSCKDIEKPVIKCPKSRKVYADTGKGFASVWWEQPDAFDNSGSVPTIRSKPPGIKSPSKFVIGTKAIFYQAVDSSGLTANCSFNVTVIDNEPPQVIRCPSTITVNTSDVQVEVFWEKPLFKDNSFERITIIQQSHKPGEVFTTGSHMVHYVAQDVSGNQATCVFDVIVTQNNCPYYPAPINGALACDDWMYGQFCQTYCNENFDFVDKPAEWYVCNAEAEWQTIPEGYSVPWPDCLRKRHPMGIRQMLHGFYYSGDCNDPNVQIAIKQAFLHHFMTKFPKWQYCITEKACTLEMVKVICGELSWSKLPQARGKRDVWQQAAKNELNIEFDILISPDTKLEISEEFFDDFLKSVESFDWNIDEELEEQMSALESTVDFDGSNVVAQGLLVVASKETQILCPTGSVLKDQECMLCPPGTFHNTTADMCIECPLGCYQESEGQTECSVCPPYTTTKGIHSINQTECKGICNEGTYSLTGLETCIACPLGTYQNETQQTDCIPCPNGTTTSTRSSKGVEDCQKLCAPGFYSTSGIEPCTPCALGFYQSLSGQTDCEHCPSNLTTLSTGSDTEIDCVDYDPCSNGSACMHGGRCVAVNHEVVCHCPSGYTGTRCEYDIDECSETPCMNRGHCINLDGSFYCNCTREFRGETCDVEINGCDPEPCMNGATCLDQYDGYLCICGPGYGGDNCEKRLDVCSNNIVCLNGATCSVNEDGGTCICPVGFAGSDCSINVNDCQNITCQNGARCIDQVAGYYCNCSVGFTGSLCETEIDECLSNQCYQGSTCIDLVGSYTCKCPPEWSGQFCEQKMNSDFILSYPYEPSLANMASTTMGAPLTEATVSVWVQTNDIDARSSALLSYAVSDTSEGNAGADSSGDTHVLDNAFTISDCSDLTVYVNNEPVNTGIQVADGAWHHLAFTWTSQNSGEWKVFKDGELVASGQNLQQNEKIPGGGHLVIGQEQDEIGGGFSPVETFSGNITRLNIWNSFFASANISRLCNLEDDIAGKVVAWPDFRGSVSGNVQLLENEKPLFNRIR